MLKYWNLSGKIKLNNLKNIANRGIESEYTIELPISSPKFGLLPIGNLQISFLKKNHPDWWADIRVLA